MIHLYDIVDRRLPAGLGASAAMLALLSATLEALTDELLPWTEVVLVQPGDREGDLVRALGFSPLVDPIDGHRWPAPLFQPGWDWIGRRPSAFQLNFSFGSTFGQMVLVEDVPGVPTDLLAMCRNYVDLGN